MIETEINESKELEIKGFIERGELCRKFQISNSTVYRWEKSGLIKGVRIGQRTFFNDLDVQTNVFGLEMTQVV